MKKQTAMALAAVFAMSVAGTALAAPVNPFVDVPAKHWSYDSINQLAKAGVISGYGDGTYQGDKTLTRYEAATLVAKAMANADKLNPENKKALEALKTEFGAELNNLGVRVAELEKNTGKIKITGEIRERYEYSKDDAVGDKSQLGTRIRLYMAAPVAENVTFKGRLAAESQWGNGGNVTLDQAYATIQNNGVTYNLGRQPIYLGQGLIADSTASNDGLVVVAGNTLKVAAAAFQKNTLGKNVSLTAANMAWQANDKLAISGAYLKDKHEDAYKTLSFGLKYTGLKDFTVTGEWANNDARGAKTLNNNTKAKAWYGKLQYKGANGTPGTFGIWTEYRKADLGFDQSGLTTLDSANWPDGALKGDNVKGLSYGFNYSVFKNGIFTIQYSAHKYVTTPANTSSDKRNLFANLIYTF